MSSLRSLSRILKRCTTIRYDVLFTRSSSTVDVSEMDKFSLSIREWWDDVNGPAAALHSMNTVRIPFIKEALLGTKDTNGELGSQPLIGYRMLDVGCGGGILCESLGMLGATVIGIDPNPVGISVANRHLSLTGSVSPGLLINYQCCSVEEHNQHNTVGYDCVIASEVLEHVPNMDRFVHQLSLLVKSGGSVIFSTINRTLSSLLFAKIAAEYIVNIVPSGTHEWNKFVTPQELKESSAKNNLTPVCVQGLCFNPLTYTWSYQYDTSINYCLHAIKN